MSAKEFELTALHSWSSHRRLRVFFYRGRKCEFCGVEGTRLILKDGHIDLYVEDLSQIMTVDHIVPRSVGGSNRLENLRPLCSSCNSKRGNDITELISDFSLFEKHLKNKWCMRKSGRPFQNGSKTAKIIDIACFLRSKDICFIFEGGFSYSAFKIKLVK